VCLDFLFALQTVKTLSNDHKQKSPSEGTTFYFDLIFEQKEAVPLRMNVKVKAKISVAQYRIHVVIFL
jgi:hypothetical protein